MGSNREYMILRPEKTRHVDILKLLIFRRRRLRRFGFVDTNVSDTSTDNWVIALVLLLQKFLAAAYKPLKRIGGIVEFLLNLVALNGGIFRLLLRFITVSVVIPKPGAANYQSIIAHIDWRLKPNENSSLMDLFSMVDSEPAVAVKVLNLSIMAAKVAYENHAYIKNAVNNFWKMHFVECYNCWNKFLEDYTTQAYIFSDKVEDASLIVVAFRGTEPFNARDWSTDVDLSWLCMGKLGRIHAGFLKALGLQEDMVDDPIKAFPKDYTGDKPVAYYSLRQQLRRLLTQHPNAKIVVTGHSLGGALAALFPAILALHDEGDILKAMYGVMTYGQPRVGDATLGTYMSTIVGLKHYRMVYRFDLVPRVPFDFPPMALFKHYGTCIYFDGWYEGLELAGHDAPNPNYFDPLYAFLMYLAAWGDLLKALFLGLTGGKDFTEGYVSILYRMVGLLIPGVASHSPRDYLNSCKLAKI